MNQRDPAGVMQGGYGTRPGRSGARPPVSWT